MIRFRCDNCGCDLDANSADRYIVSIEVYAAAPTLEFSNEDLEKDHRAEIDAVIRRLHDADPDAVEDQVYRRLRFDLCPPCHRRFLDNPLAR